MKAIWIGLLAAVSASSQPSDRFQALDEVFSDYDVIQLNPSDVEFQVKVLEEPLTLKVDGSQLVFKIEPNSLLSEKYRAEATGDDGLRQQLPLPEEETYKGTLVGAPDIQGRFTITEDRFDGVILTPGDWLYIESIDNYLPDADGMVVYRDSAVLHDVELSCGGLHHFDEQASFKLDIPAPKSTDFDTTYTAEVATEADYEFVREFRNVSGANREILRVLNRVEGVYEDSLKLKIEVTYQHGWNTRNDPYSGTDSRDLIEQFNEYWNENLFHEDYDLAHMWTARDMDGGGIAAIGTVCNARFFSYGISKYYSDAPSRVSFIIAAHEIGHNFGADHPDQESPPVRSCDGTIMQSDWDPEPRLTFCNFSRREIRNHVTRYNSCFPEGSAAPPTPPPPPPPPPVTTTAPSNLTTEALSSTQVRLQWQDNSQNEVWFGVERTVSGARWPSLAVALAGENRTAFVDSDLTPATTYNYRMFATGLDGKSAYSNIATITTPATDRPDPQCACPSADRILTPGAAPLEFTLPAVDAPWYYGSRVGFLLNITAKATSMNIMLKTTTPGVDVDMFASHYAWPYVWDGRMFSDHSSTGDAGDEQIFVVPTHDPPLRPGTYFISFVMWTVGTEATATIQAIVE